MLGSILESPCLWKLPCIVYLVYFIPKRVRSPGVPSTLRSLSPRAARNHSIDRDKWVKDLMAVGHEGDVLPRG